MPISIESNGRISFSGLSSGIDFKAAVDAIISARRIPIDSLETRITDNETKIGAYNELRTLLGTLKDAMNKLRGAVTLGDVDNVFKGKSVFASTSRADAAIPSQAGNLMGVTVTNAAAIGPHTVEISRIATSHKIASRNFTSLATDLGTASGGAAGSISGSFNIGTSTISVLATDKLTDLRDRINAANTGATATGVTASIVTVSATQNILVLTKDATASNITIGTEVGGVLSSLGISSDGGTTFTNVLQTAQTAQFYADGILDSSKWQSTLVANPAAAVSTYAGVTAGAHTFNILDANGAVLKTVNYTDASTLNSLAAAITDVGLGLSATVISEAGQSRLQVVRTGAPDNAISFATDTNNLLAGLTFSKQRLLLERTSNTVTDLFGGTTLTLYGAELGTTIKLDVDRDLTGVKTAVTTFVDAYNAVRTFVNTQTQTDSVTGTRSDEAGPLFGSRTLAEISDSLTRILGTDTKGVSTSFSVLAQIGVKFVTNNTLSDPLLADTLTVDTTKLDAVLLSNPEDVRKLFSFDFSSSDSRVSLLGFTGRTTYAPGGYTLNLTHNGTALTAADINGVGSSTTFSGNTITATGATGADGLLLIYTGNTSVAGITIDFTVGAAVQMFFELDNVLNTTTGSIQTEIEGLTDQNTDSEKRVLEMLERLDYQREQLTDRFIAMETSLATMNRILDNIKQTTDAWSKQNR